MEYKNLLRLETLRKLNANSSWINSELYRLMYKEDLYVVAYEKIKSNPGNMTPGADGSTLDGFSMATIENIIEQMRNESFEFSRAKRTYIPKSDGSKRALGIAPPRDKVVQEVLKMILESIYDSPYGATFKDTSHGFRPKYGCHTALREIRKWSGINWVIEGDIKGCFDNIDHNILISILRKRISDERFLRLIRKALNAGYLEFHVPKDSIVGTPQGSVLSPILANIYMHEFDLFMERLVEKCNKGKERAINPEYRKPYKARQWMQGKLKSIEDPVKRAEVVNEIRKLRKEMNKFPSLLPIDPNFIRVKYTRYADDWVIAVIGSKELAEGIRQEAKNFLSDELKLTLSLEKTHIRHAKTEEAFFLGTRIRFGMGEAKHTKTRRGEQTFTRRSTGWNSLMFAPVDKLVKKLYDRGFCDSQGKPRQKGAWSVLDDVQIIEMYNSVYRGMLNYYSFVNCYSNLRRIEYILQYSAAKTLAHKHRTSVPKIFKKHGNNLTIKFVSGKGEEKKKSFGLETRWQTNPNRFRTSGEVYKGPDGVIQTHWRLRTRSKLESPCAICDSTSQVEMHHIRHVRKIGQKSTGFNRLLAQLNRKQIPICADCHDGVHAGRYDGLGLKDLANPSVALR